MFWSIEYTFSKVQPIYMNWMMRMLLPASLGSTERTFTGFNLGVLSDTVYTTHVKLWMVMSFTQIYPFIPILLTLALADASVINIISSSFGRGED